MAAVAMEAWAMAMEASAMAMEVWAVAMAPTVAVATVDWAVAMAVAMAMAHALSVAVAMDMAQAMDLDLATTIKELKDSLLSTCMMCRSSSFRSQGLAAPHKTEIRRGCGGQKYIGIHLYPALLAIYSIALLKNKNVNFILHIYNKLC